MTDNCVLGGNRTRLPTVLITGGTGYIGCHLIRSLVSGDAERLGLGAVHYVHFKQDALPVSESSCGGSIVPHRVDLADSKAVLDVVLEVMPDTIVHLAALSITAQCEADPVRAELLNVQNVRNVLEAVHAVRQTGRSCRLIHFSTEWVYGMRPHELSMHLELSPTELTGFGVYGSTKLEAERLVAASSDVVVLRSALVYGLQSPYTSRGTFLQFITKGLRSGRVELFHDAYLTPVFISDVLQAIRQSLQLKQVAGCVVINLGGPERLSRFDMGRLTADVLGAQSVIVPVSRSDFDEKRPTDLSMNTSRLREVLGVQPTPFRDALLQIREHL